MNLMTYTIPHLLGDAAAPAPGGLQTDTVLLGLLILAALWLASSVSSLRREVESLKELMTPKARAVAAAAVPAVAGPSSSEIAAIAAAVHFTLGARARVVAVVPPDASAQTWSREGRREVFQSHQIR